MSKKETLVKGQEPRLVVPNVELQLLHDFDRFSNGAMLMRIADTEAIVSDDDNKEIARIGAAMGGSIYVMRGRRTWVMDREKFLNLFFAAEDEQYAAVPPSARESEVAS